MREMSKLKKKKEFHFFKKSKHFLWAEFMGQTLITLREVSMLRFFSWTRFHFFLLHSKPFSRMLPKSIETFLRPKNSKMLNTLGQWFPIFIASGPGWWNIFKFNSRSIKICWELLSQKIIPFNREIFIQILRLLQLHYWSHWISDI